MKSKIVFLLSLLLYSCASYQIISYDQPFVKVFDDIQGTQDQLFIKANEWMIKTFTNPSSVIEFTDKEEGIIMGKYLMFGEAKASAYISIDTRVFAKIDIRVKDNKARISIEPLDKWNYDPYTIYNYSKEDCMKDLELLSENLHKTLLSEAVTF
jgi:hypothetical protein